MCGDIELRNEEMIKLLIPLLAYLKNENKNMVIPVKQGIAFFIFSYPQATKF